MAANFDKRFTMDVGHQYYMIMLRVSKSSEVICSVKNSCALGQFFAGPTFLVPEFRASGSTAAEGPTLGGGHSLLHYPFIGLERSPILIA